MCELKVEKSEKTVPDKTDNDFFGMWKDRDDMKDVEQYICDMRKGRREMYLK